MTAPSSPGARRSPAPVLAPLLDRLLDAEPDRAVDRPASPAESVALLRRAVHRDLEALLNARRPWRTVADRFPALRLSPVTYGIPDFTAGAYNDRQQREVLRAEIEETIQRFEPRLAQVQVRLSDDGNLLRATLRLSIDALLRTHPAPEPIVFDTMIDTTTADVVLNPVYGY
ncbi:type VI secretion protein [Aliidongia dinghuensis]|uniref:Type VI secretion protein n=1 Tax=Aliidongia dinghuensis TaxID=1867774 RepID=A0A8J2YY58_9PROT|nr:type VI secretion system baseplate subunit TssE [Aliidongia dinghuensis]GGF34687.1 type VI secretion protein [Aliidongia dinghuensis]